MTFAICPRCHDLAYERLATHAYCVSCDYCPELMAYWKPLRRPYRIEVCEGGPATC
jgi:hypothetical protein